MTASQIGEDALFNASRQIDDRAARELYLRKAVGGDEALLRRVEALLAVYETPDRLLDQPAAAGVSTGALTPACPADLAAVLCAESIGTQIGPYKLLQQIGEGGMGTVYMAEQTEAIRRKVALKIIKAGMDSRQVVARFEAERQALAMMDHVNIARVFDGGATQNGRPYFVMELVHGVPITKYCDAKRLTPRERLELFVPVCEAIQHAHQRGIIHRDIKPSNVMITLNDGKPVPKVIDFGVAKATEPKLTERTLFTQYGTMVGTLEYMSPEQAEMNAQGVDTRSDIYSLGVLLYELLAGSTPLTHKRLKETAYAEILRMIKEEEPQKPSTRLSDSGEALASISSQRRMEPAKLTKLVKGELDWIVMKSLEKDRDRRYEAANSFAADIRRHLNDEPVLAHPPSALYRFRKFARCNKVELVTASLLAVALVAVIAALAISYIRVAREQGRTKAAYEAETQQRRRAQDNFAQALRGIETMVKGINQELSLTDPARSKLLEGALAQCQDLLKEKSDDESARQGRGSAYMMIAQIQIHLGHPVLAEGGFRQALEVFSGLVEDYPNRSDYRYTLAHTHSLFGRALRIAPARPQDAEEHDRRAIEMLNGLSQEDPGKLTYQVELGQTYHELGYLLWSRGRWAEAETAYRQALAVQQPLAAGLGSSVSESATDVANTLNSLGILLRINQRLEEAESAFRQALDALNKLPPDLLAVGATRQQLARSQGHLAIVLGQTGRYAEAERVVRLALRIREKAAADAPHLNKLEASQEVALTYRYLGWLLAAGGQPREAEKAYVQALALMGQVLDVAPAAENYRLQQAMAQSDLGNLCASAGERQKAKLLFQQALAGFRLACEGSTGDPDRRNYMARFLATCPDAQIRNPAQAVALAKTAVALAPLDGVCWNTLGIALYRAGDWKEAAQALEKSALMRSGGSGTDWFFLAMAHWQLGQKDDARKWYDRAVRWMEKTQRQDEELLRFRAEAAELLVIVAKAKPGSSRKSTTEALHK